MLQSTLIRFITLCALSGSVILLSLWFVTSDGVQTAYAESLPEPSIANLDIPAVEPDAPIEVTELKVASLTVLTEDVDLKTFSDMPRTATDTGDRLRIAKRLTEGQKFEEALAVLKSVKDSDQNQYAVKFLEARILSWSGKHYKAEQTFKTLVRHYPQDPDIAVSYGYLKLYQNDYIQAERLFRDVLDKHPEYQDARNGLNRALSR